MTGFNLRIDLEPADGELEFGAPVTVSARRNLHDSERRQTQVVVAPVGRTRNVFVAAPPGTYDLQAILPTGELLTAQAVVEGNTVGSVLLRRDEDLPGQTVRLDAFQPASSRGFKSAIFASDSAPSSEAFTVSLGEFESSEGGDLNPTRWEDWSRWLGRRALAASEGADLPLPFSPNLRTQQLSASWATPAEDDADAAAILQLHRIIRQWSDPKAVGARRSWASVRSDAGQRMFLLPWPWPETGGPDLLYEIQLAERKDRLVCETSLRDARFGSLFAYLNAGRIGRAGQLLDAAEAALFEKWENPLAAAAGGYVLLSTGKRGASRDWPAWLDNLARHFPHLPDGPILRARWLMENDGDAEEIHQLLLQSLERGLPFYSAGVAWLIDGLRRVAIDCTVCRSHLAMIRGVARFIDFSQAFTTFDLPAASSALAMATRAAMQAPRAEDRLEPSQSGIVHAPGDEAIDRHHAVSLPTKRKGGLVFTLELFPAREGDALVLTWGSADAPRRMLIDAGRAKTAEALREYATKNELGNGAFELFVITHIDRDHIEGAVPLLRDEATSRLFKQVWFNGRKDLEWAPPDHPFEAYGALDGERVSQALLDANIPWNTHWLDRPVAIVDQTLPSVKLADGLKLTLLSPDLDQLAALAEPWDETIEAAPEGWERYGDAEPLALEFLAKRPFKGDRAKPNGSSIALVAEFEGKRILLGADAHSPRLIESLTLYGGGVGPVPFNLVKAPHHGSRANVSPLLVQAVTCRNWVFSTNGDQFKHPDAEGVARAIWFSPENTTVYFNYRTLQTEPWSGRVTPPRDFVTRYGTDGYLTIDIMSL